MEIEEYKASPRLDVLTAEGAQEVTLAGSRLSEHHDVLRAPFVRNDHALTSHFAVRHPDSERETCLRPFAAGAPEDVVPHGCDDVFEDHE